MGTANNLVQRLRGKPGKRERQSTPAIVAVLLSPDDANVLLRSLESVEKTADWRLEFANSVESGLQLALAHASNTILLNHATLANWRSALGAFANLPELPAVFLVAEDSGPNLRAELTQSGGYGILSLPFDAKQATSAIYAAWLFWNNHDHLRRLTK